ncbi:putative choline dehydrogenase [Apodospora peruviana]|uniref:Choline dehydrogenase n=1 Tax=Apodospora peruviana TaxID=516989 RepID=A0AAE0M2M7_9PEZI|nr:putative choline dehydrogenase [Apodospora peruviana]
MRRGEGPTKVESPPVPTQQVGSNLKNKSRVTVKVPCVVGGFGPLFLFPPCVHKSGLLSVDRYTWLLSLQRRKHIISATHFPLSFERMASPGEAFAEKGFDFLVVGGGTAGLTVAARLADASPDIRVGVLEAGGLAIGDGLVEWPGIAGRALGSHLDWSFETAPQPGLGGRVVPWNRGRVLGGSSALNYMTWNRAAQQDYDDWKELGNEGWGWDDLLPFFKKSENFHTPTSKSQKAAQIALHDGFVGVGGPVQVSYPNEFTASHALWHQTLNSVGVETNDAHLAGSNVGCWTSTVSVDPRTATRSYAATAYYQPNAWRMNLVVLTEAEVLEILLSSEDGGGDSNWKATGVRFTHQGTEYSASASREVIVSAGSVQSPQILELSGIGGKEVLSAAGIPVKVDNPNVGENLQDHMTTTLLFEVDPSLPNPDDLKTDSLLVAAKEEYAKSLTGPLTVLPVSMAYIPASTFIPPSTLSTLIPSTLNTEQTTSAADRDALLCRRFSSSSSSKLGHMEFVFDLGNWSPIELPPNDSNPKKYASMLQILQYPFSKGSIHISPTRSLTINPQYYSGKNGHLDLEVALHAHRFAERIVAAQPLATLIKKQISPTPEESATDDNLRKWLRKVMVTDWHPVGTCAMGGRLGREGGVVDQRLKVYGVQGLRIVDASVMPLQISAHLQATVYAIAEKAAVMVLEDCGIEM